MSEVIENIDEVLEEDTANMATIEAKPTDVSRSELMAMMVDYASKADKIELAQFVASLPNAAEKSDTVEKNWDLVNSHASGDAAKNQASIKSAGKASMPMASVKEDLELVFGSTELSEEFRDKVATLFEAAVSTRVGVELARIEEEYSTKLEEEVGEIYEEMVDNVDKYISYGIAEWIKENQLAIDNNIRTEVAESFMQGLKSLFDEHYVNIPEDQVDVVEALTAHVAELEEQINKQEEANIELANIVNEMNIEKTVIEMSEGLTDTQKEKFLKLAEAIEVTDSDEFRKKASIIKETYFSGKDVKTKVDSLLSEEVEDEPKKAPKIADPEMAMYVNNLSRIVSKEQI
jgi:hypothetical protein